MAEILGTYVLGTDTISTIEAGVQNENDASCVKFDYSDWKEEYGDGILSMRIQRREDDDPYPVLLTVSTDPDDGENVMVWSISDVDTAQIGKHKAQLTYTVDGVRKKTTVFLYRIVRSVVSGDAVPDPYDDWLEDLESMASDMLDDGAAIVNEAKGYRNEASGYATAASGSATSASNSASDSEAYAKGTRGGTEVESDDPSYHNNSKYYSEQAYLSSESASGYASNASESAIDASGSATSSAGYSQNSEAWAKGTRGGTPVGSDDPAYHNNSSYYAGQADSSAYDANQSNVEAAQHESNAEAFASGTRNTVPVSSTDPAYHNNSKYFSGQASASATAASGSATAAAGSATAAAASVSSLAPAYSSSATYDVGDYVLYSGSLYRCTTAITTAEEWTAAHWTAAKMSEDVSDLKSDLTQVEAYFAGAYDSSATYDVGDYVVYENVLYKCKTAITTAEAWTAAHWEAVALADEVQNKADIRGYYQDMTVGDAEQLISTQFVEDSDPYLFRPTGGSADVGNREYLDKIVGGTVAWNQLVGESNLLAYTSSTGVVTTKNGDGTLTINGTATGAFRITQNLATEKSHVYFATDANKQVRLYNGMPACGITNKDIGGLIKNTSSDSWDLYCYENGTAFNDTKVKPMLIDLTALFNPTIADYIYSLEQSQAGAGVAWFRRYFPEEYYPYSANTLQSVQATSHKTYDGDGNVIGNYALDSSLTLRGIPKLDASNNLYYDGDTYASDGTVTRKCGVVTFDGSSDENISAGTSGYPFRILLPQDSTTQIVITEYANTFTNYLTQVKQADTWGVAMTFSRANGQRYLYFKITDSMTDISELRTYLASHPLVVVYELATPTTETADAYEQYQICDPSGTEQFVTDSIVPVGHETRYPHDLKKKIETAPDSPSTDGTYLMKRSGGKNTYMALPSTPSANGAYVLTVTVSGGTASYSWTAKE